MERWVNLLQKIVEGHRSATIVTLEVSICLYRIDITPGFVLILLRVTTDWASKIV
jgi:hypothetical protein